MSKDPASPHYDAGGIEVLDIIKAKLTPEQYQGYLLGNVIKYACRLNWKNAPADDARKAEMYARWLTEELRAAQHAPIRPQDKTTKRGKNDPADAGVAV